MTKSYADVLKQINELNREAERLKRKEVGDVIARIKEAIRVYGITAQDLGLMGHGRPAAKKTGGRKSVTPGGRRNAARPAKFRDEAGNVWGGRGPRPQWLRDALAAGKELRDFAV